MGFADDFMRGLVVGRQLRQQREELGLQKQRLGMQDAFQQQQLERQKALDERNKALEDIQLVRMLPQPEQALPPGQAGPPMPLPKRTVNVPGFGVVTPPDLTDLTVQKRAQEDLAQSRELDLLKQKAGIERDANKITVGEGHPLTKFGLAPGDYTSNELSTYASLQNAEEARKSRYAAQLADAARRGDAAKLIDFQKAFTRASSLRDDYRQSPAYKQYATVLPQLGIIESAGKNPTAAGDLALVYSYVKTLDPNSTVRESEFANAAQAGAFGDKVKAAVGRALKGTLLDDTMRADFVKTARQTFESYKAQKLALDRAYEQLAAKSQVPADMVITPDVDFGASAQPGKQADPGGLFP